MTEQGAPRPAFDEAWWVKYLEDIYWPEGAHIWLTAPHKSFGGRSARELIEAGERERVMREIDMLRSGAFS